MHRLPIVASGSSGVNHREQTNTRQYIFLTILHTLKCTENDDLAVIFIQLIRCNSLACVFTSTFIDFVVKQAFCSYRVLYHPKHTSPASISNSFLNGVTLIIGSLCFCCVFTSNIICHLPSCVWNRIYFSFIYNLSRLGHTWTNFAETFTQCFSEEETHQCFSVCPP